MNKKQRELLLKDLCARLPYGVKMQIKNEIVVLDSVCDDDGYHFNFIGDDKEGVNIEQIKPYLFPMSSITEEQALELYKLFGIKLTDLIGWDYIKINEVTGITFFLQKGFDVETHLDKLIDWLLKNNFDFRGLIPKGLALDATGLNIY